MKRVLLHLLALTFSIHLLGAQADDWTAAVAADLAQPVRPGGVKGRPFWNGNAVMFMYPPAFDFKSYVSPTGEKVTYRFEIIDAKGRFHYLTAAAPTDSLAPVWKELPTGQTTVICRALEGWYYRAITVGTRSFWKSAPFTGNYPARKRDYAEAAKAALDYVLDAPSVRYFREKNEPDPGFQCNAYPTKMLSAIAEAACAVAASGSPRGDEARALARQAADWLIAQAEKPGSPLAHFPPTYRGEKMTAGKFAGQVMLHYPASAANAYLRVWEVTKDDKYLKAAEMVATTYLKLQGTDGTWPLKMKLADGSSIGLNRLVPVASVLPMLEKLSKVTGKSAYRAAADRAFANLERTRIATWNWEGQFEDVIPSEPYLNLTKHDACSTAIYLAENVADDPEKAALARELLRFAEDQFVCWEKPFAEMDCTKESSMLDLDKWVVPGVLEQYYWYIPIDASAAKLICTYLALWRTARRPLDLAKAKALADVITRVQWADGGIPTEWPLGPSANSIWMNCHISAALALDELARAMANDGGGTNGGE